MGVAIAGLTSDARVLSTYMRGEAMKSHMLFARPLPVQRIAAQLGDKAQVNTQRYGRRPYGVGLLIAGYDEAGPHLFEVAPSGNFFDYFAMSIGARSQSAKTYLENHFEEFPDAPLDALVVHGLRALRDTLPQDKELSAANCSVGIVGKDVKWNVVEGDALQRYLDVMNAEAPAPAAADDAAPDDAAPMDTDA
ncbi:hypothetical protein HDU83_003755 [Entophlyctis luteolus]|nr:hypothetical protein HDU83_003755 [Entophlyctis luteolus]